jgi:quercetin dioxygenase-like cupin family protein
MEITRLYTDNNGESHFDVTPVIMEEKSDLGFFAEIEGKVKSTRLQNTLPHHVWDFHSANSKIYIFILDGSIELQTSDGERKIFEKGDVIYLNDRSGKGHKVTTFEKTVCGLIMEME